MLGALGVADANYLNPTFEAWSELGAIDTKNVPTDESGEAYERWSILQRVFGRINAPISVSVQSEGFVGAQGAKLRLFINEKEWRASDGFIGWMFDAPPPPVIARVATLTYECAQTRPAQLARWGRVKALLGLIEMGMGDIVTIKVDPHLASLDIRTPEHFALNWLPAGTTGRTVSLELSEIDTLGQQQRLDLSGFDAETGLVSKSGREHILLPDAVSRVARLVRDRQGTLKSRVAQEIVTPAELFPEGLAADQYFDLKHYSQRVLGFEPVKATESFSQFDRSTLNLMDDISDDGCFLALSFKSNTERWVLRLETTDEASAFLNDVVAALNRPSPSHLSYRGRNITADNELRDTVSRAIAVHRQNDATAQINDTGNRTTLAAVIESRDATDAIEQDGPVCDESRVPFEQLTTLLRPNVELKPHQRQGVAWMWNHLERGESGALLADDMGLGKTIQVATFMALNRQMGHTSDAPMMVVAPTILLDNWLTELGQFFCTGAFGRVALLHGLELETWKYEGSLDIARLSKTSLILTNYDTLARFQVSLLRIDYSIVAFDEAQNVKNESTLRSRAAQGLKRRFAVAMTGTPVENRLLDLWAIFEVLQPRAERRVFGRKSEFEAIFERNQEVGPSELRRRLQFPSANSLVLRREKASTLRDLPAKQIHVRRVPMTPRQHELERSIARELSTRGHFRVLDKLRKLYQHPELVAPRAEGDVLSADDVLQQSPKVAETLAILESVHARGEKVIVFTQWLGMQYLLQRVIRKQFGLSRLDIINGEPSLRSRATEAIASFSDASGFAVMILSPLAAGVGLTITAANHVVHYGRWWNPAKEDQATDRVHRIGQVKEVHVYFPLLHHPDNPNGGFDIRLHNLVERKRSIARDFLTPSEDTAFEQEVMADLRRGYES
jgi:SNF2 family DNA or RNA helicase